MNQGVMGCLEQKLIRNYETSMRDTFLTQKDDSRSFINYRQTAQ
jgi:hypothetical protein